MDIPVHSRTRAHPARDPEGLIRHALAAADGDQDQDPNQKLIPSLPNGTLRALSSQQHRTDMKGNQWPIDVQRILRVNHSGEFGAIGIYQSQLFLARMVWPSGRDLLAEMLIDERRHLNVFAGMLAQRNIRPCHALLLWRVGGYGLGIAHFSEEPEYWHAPPAWNLLFSAIFANSEPFSSTEMPNSSPPSTASKRTSSHTTITVRMDCANEVQLVQAYLLCLPLLLDSRFGFHQDSNSKKRPSASARTMRAAPAFGSPLHCGGSGRQGPQGARDGSRAFRYCTRMCN